MRFPLTIEPWIPCRNTANEPMELGLRDVITRAHDLIEIRDGSPLITLALYRLVLALLHRVFGPSSFRAWRALHDSGRFDDRALDAYLEQWSERFDLLHDQRPFYQSRGLTRLYEPDDLARLVFERSNYGAPVLVFQHRPSDVLRRDAMSLSEAARALVALHGFAPGGLVKKPGEPGSATAAPLNRGAFVLLQGKTLFETLMLNLLVCDGRAHPVPTAPDDSPSWEQDPLPRPIGPKEPARAPKGWLDLLTWQSRRLELITDGKEVRGVVYCVGQGLQRVGPTPEPMLAYRSRKKDIQPVELSEERALWRDSHALIQLGDANAIARPPLTIDQIRRRELEDVVRDSPITLNVLGMRGDQAKIKLTRAERLVLPAQLLGDQERQTRLRDCIDLSEEVSSLVRISAFQAIEDAMAPDRTADAKQVRALAESLAPERAFWTALGAPFESFLREIAGDEGSAARNFAVAVRAAAESSLLHVVKALGSTARQLQGAARAERRLRAGVEKLIPAHPTPGGA